MHKLLKLMNFQNIVSINWIKNLTDKFLKFYSMVINIYYITSNTDENKYKFKIQFKLF